MSYPNQNPEQQKADQHEANFKELQDNFDKARKTLKEKNKDAQKKLDDAFNSKAAERTTDEIALGTLRTLQHKQKLRIEKIHEKYRNRLESEAAVQRKSLQERVLVNANFDPILEQADAEAQRMVDTISGILDLQAQQGGDKKRLEVDEIAKLSDLLEQVSGSMQDPKFQELLKKMDPESPDQKELNTADFNKLAEMLYPDEQGKTAEISKTNAKILIRLLNPEQRMEFMNAMMEGEHRNKTAKTIDEFLSANMITLRQGKRLIAQAREKNAISEERLNRFMVELETKYPKVQAEFEAQEAKVAEELKGQYSTNVFNRGTQLVGMLMSAHSAIWFFGNVLTSGGDFNRILNNPYLALAAAEGVSGYYITRYGGKVGTSYAGLGPLFEYFTGSDAPKNPEEQQAILDLSRLDNKNTHFGDFLRIGGAKAIIDLRQDHKVNKNDAPVTYEDVKDKVKGSEAMLNALEPEKAHTSEKAFEISMNERIAEFIKIAEVLNITDQDDFNHKIKLIEQSQGLRRKETNNNAR